MSDYSQNYESCILDIANLSVEKQKSGINKDQEWYMNIQYRNALKYKLLAEIEETNFPIESDFEPFISDNNRNDNFKLLRALAERLKVEGNDALLDRKAILDKLIVQRLIKNYENNSNHLIEQDVRHKANELIYGEAD